MTHEGVEAPFYFSALQLRLCQIEYEFENSVTTESRIARRDPGILKKKTEKNDFAKAISPSRERTKNKKTKKLTQES
jgi:hypothetical protein